MTQKVYKEKVMVGLQFGNTRFRKKTQRRSICVME
jgi:hypothetical protein